MSINPSDPYRGHEPPNKVKEFHFWDDLDQSQESHHHSIGPTSTQAAPGSLVGEVGRLRKTLDVLNDAMKAVQDRLETTESRLTAAEARITALEPPTSGGGSGPK